MFIQSLAPWGREKSERNDNYAIFLPPSFLELNNLKELILDRYLFFIDRNNLLNHLEKEKSSNENPINILSRDIRLLSSLE